MGLIHLAEKCIRISDFESQVQVLALSFFKYIRHIGNDTFKKMFLLLPTLQKKPISSLVTSNVKLDTDMENHFANYK